MISRTPSGRSRRRSTHVNSSGDPRNSAQAAQPMTEMSIPDENDPAIGRKPDTALGVGVTPKASRSQPRPTSSSTCAWRAAVWMRAEPPPGQQDLACPDGST
jgi:hypothetical protein